MQNSHPGVELENRAIQAIRFLALDAIQTANSGHPGLPLGTAAMAYTLWTRHLRHCPQFPGWFNRDRFILSGGHGSMLLYALLHLTGYDLSLDELKQFRQWGSQTPGHPEAGLTPGVETTTGPLGQGVANGVGMALAEAHLAEVYNRPGYPIIDHYTYGIVTDGDLMEGVAAEAASLAGHLHLSKLIYLYDDNHVTIEGHTSLAFTEDVSRRFEAYGWQVIHVPDGNSVEQVDQAIQAARQDRRPSLIICKTMIGYGLVKRQGTAKAHSDPPGWEEINAAKELAGWPVEPKFYIPEDVLKLYRQARERGLQEKAQWEQQLAAYSHEYPDAGAELKRRISGNLPANWEKHLPVFPADPKGLATRVASGKVINALAPVLPELVGGSADLAPSNKTWIDQSVAIRPGSFAGRNIHFGVREHGMGAIINGMALHGGLRPYGATFLVFSDYMRPAVRLSALSHIPAIWVFTHDSIGVGEDGPTHQPVEHFAALRAIPNLIVLRPADANETAEAWRVALQQHHTPVALLLSRQNIPTLDRSTYAPAGLLERGAYILFEQGNPPEIILLASGSEVGLVVEAARELAKDGVGVRVVSFPSWELFEAQPPAYQEQVLPPGITRRLAVEAGVSLGWHRWVGPHGRVISLDRFGASAPGEVAFENLGFSAANILRVAREMLKA